jgi:hypothetical protein
VFHELLERNTVDKNNGRDFDIVRLHESVRVQAPILVTLPVRILYARPPAPVRGGD